MLASTARAQAELHGVNGSWRGLTSGRAGSSSAPADDIDRPEITVQPQVDLFDYVLKRRRHVTRVEDYVTFVLGTRCR
jgi:hypothetical protein